ncbi:MAG: type II toxin-antitoxin system VapB family antitoxin [Actinobacteria bacterium]|nr:type II toxin-antitoxin system VapB family antitoxin [Actinomycetota bacterium]
MRTTLDIDRNLLDEAVRVLGASSKREAIETALAEVVSASRRRELIAALGTFDLALTPEDLVREREDE